APDLEIIPLIFEQRIRPAAEMQGWQGIRLPVQLKPCLLQVIVIQMDVPTRPYELSGNEIALMRHHMSQECIRCYIERLPQEIVRATLVQLARKFSLPNIELKERVTRGQSHAVDFRRV